jgi:alpha-mannosidase
MQSLAVCGLTLTGLAAYASPTVKHDALKHKAVTKPTLYVVGYSHLDTQWCWSYPQVIREFIPNTLHENFALFEKYPDYVFNWTGSNRYRFMKEYYPEDYAKLKKYVAAGRWFPAGSSIEEGDVNSPSAESLVRQVMYGNDFFRKEFGKASDEYMLPDCFGFPASLPSILAHAGVKGFSTQKLTWGSAVGIPFQVGNWIGPDGRSVVAALDATSYGSDIEPDLVKNPRWVQRMDKNIKVSGVPVDYRYYGTGDRGGSPDPNDVKRLMDNLHAAGPLTLSAGRADQMFNDLSADQIAKLPTYQGDLELTQHSAGSLTSEAAMKRWNRKNEFLGDEAEKASVAAAWLGALPYDHERLTDAWLRFLPGQFHDLMAGTALPVAYTYTWNDEVIAMNEFADVLQSSVGGVARAMDTQVEGIPLVIYNPLAIARQDVVEATVRFQEAAPSAVKVFGPDGKEVPAQIVSREGKSVRVLILAQVPSVGYAVYDVRPSSSPVSQPSDLSVTENSLENARYRVKIDENGDVSSVFDKQENRELLAKPARLVYMHENPSQYPAWNMDWDDQKQPPRAVVSGPYKAQIVESGPVRVGLRITRYHEGSEFVQTIRLSSGTAGDRVEFDTQIDWQGKESALKAEFPLTVSNPQATYNWDLGTVQRGNNDPKKYEVASHGWFDLTNPSGDYGVSVINDCKFGSDKPSDDTLRLTLLYSPGVRAGYQHQATQDWGHNQMLYALVGHAHDWRNGTQWQSARINQPLVAFEAVKHAGPIGKSFSFVQVSNPNIAVMALKRAESSSSTIVRLNELSGSSADDVHVKFPAAVVSAVEVDGQERPIGSAKIVNGELVFSTTGYRPHSFAIKLATTKSPISAPKSRAIALPFNADGISSWAKKTDGDFDGTGKTIPGELLPKSIVSDGVNFEFGPTADGAKNVVIAQGQKLAIPAGKDRTLYLLASSVAGDRRATFLVGDKPATLNIQAWDGYIGQWDYRLWEGQVPELTYDWHNPLGGLVPGFIKRAPVAWYSDHRRLADGTNDIYAFAYAFRYGIRIPDNVDSVTLPTDSGVRVLAASVASNPNDDVRPAQPLYDVINHRTNTGPSISPASGEYHDTIKVELGHTRYWTDKDTIRYTLDGSKPSADSKAYDGPFMLASDAKLRVSEFASSGTSSPIASADLSVNDTTPPSVEAVTSLPNDREVHVRFSEPVDKASAEDPGHYVFMPGATIESAKLGADGQTVVIVLDQPLPIDGPKTLRVSGVKDISPNANVANGVTTTFATESPVFLLSDPRTFEGRRGFGKNVEDLPFHATDPWTINMFVYMDKQPDDLTIIGGFGDGDDNSGAERFLIQHGNGIEFWGSNVDIETGVPFDTGKWQMITATFDGQAIKIFKNGKLLKSESATLAEAAPSVQLGIRPPWDGGHRFAGKIAGFSIWKQSLSEPTINALLSGTPKE